MAEYFVKERIAFITLNNPPVNALSLNVRSKLLERLNTAIKDDNVKAIAITGGKKIFSAGADITEFKTKKVFENFIAFVINDIEKSPKPVFALLKGKAIGGGFEIALGCHFRVAEVKASFALPEIKLGILPAGGGTQRLPRLVGFIHGADIICSGRTLSAAEALSKKLIDEVIIPPDNASSNEREEYFDQKAVEYIKSHWDEKLDERKVSSRPFEGVEDFFCDETEKAIRAKAKGMISPVKTFQLLKQSVNLSFSEGLSLEQKFIGELIKTEQAKALQYIFFAETNTIKIKEHKNIKPLDIRTIGIVGAGTMGVGIAVSFISSGYRTIIVEQSEKGLSHGVGEIEKIISHNVKKGKITHNKAKKILSLLTKSLKVEDLSDADMVVEAVFEDLKVKQSVVSKLDKICKKESLLCTNTSTLDVDKIASATSRPDKVIGMHFFAPANVMKLLEIVQGQKTSNETSFNVMRVSKSLRKVPVLVKNCFGFVANRMLLAYMSQAFEMILEGVLAEEVDKAMESYGFPMGPFSVVDLSGVDILHHIKVSALDSMVSIDSDYAGLMKTFVTADRLYEKKQLGIKTKKGFYVYDGTKKHKANAEVTEMVLAIRKEQGIIARKISEKEILERCLFVMINEGIKCLQEGIAGKPSDIDIIWVFGFGFPPYRGGPMFQADQIGLANVLSKVKAFHRQKPKQPYWKPAKLLENLSKDGLKLAKHLTRQEVRSKL